MTSRLVPLSLLLICWLGAGCTSNPEEEPDEPVEEPEVTYHQHIRPLVDEHCAGCHDQGGIGPYRLDTFDSLSKFAGLANSAIQRGSMPPWMPDPDCRDYQNERLLTQEEKDLFAKWVELETPEGNPEHYVAPDLDTVVLGEPDMILEQTAAYEPSVEGGDEYRCFLLDGEFEEDTYLKGLDIVPGDRAVVHHANMFLINGDNADKALALEAEDGKPGYDCFGDTGVTTIDLVNAWVPGAQPIRLEEGLAVRIPKGSRFILQTHFNTINAPPAPVKTKMHLYTTDVVPERTARAMPFANLGIRIPAGDSSSKHTTEIKNWGTEPWDVFGAAAHLHLLGKSVRIDHVKKDGTTECLLDIPEWDFDWQQAYFFEDDDKTQILPGESIRLTCEYDNSVESQPVIDGERQAPRDVRWGGGTFDEMCLAFLPVAQDFDPESVGEGELCEEFKTCREACDDPYSVGCVVTCGTEELACGECMLGGTTDCGRRHCNEELKAAMPCLLTCAQGAQAGGDVDACLLEQCPEKRNTLEGCMRPIITNGYCDQDLEECNVALGGNP